MLIERERKEINKIPEELASEKFKNSLMKMRENIMHRTVQVDLLKLRRTEWTTSKLMDEAALEEKEKQGDMSEVGTEVFIRNSSWGKRTTDKKLRMQKTDL